MTASSVSKKKRSKKSSERHQANSVSPTDIKESKANSAAHNDTNSSIADFEHITSISEQMSEDIVSVSDNNSNNGLDSSHKRVISLQSSISGFSELDLGPNHTQKDGQITRTDSAATLDGQSVDQHRHMLELKRENAKIHGQLQSMQTIVEEMNQQRTQLTNKIYELEKQMKRNHNQSTDMGDYKRRLLSENEDLKASITKWETIAAEYQEVIDRKDQQVTLAIEEQKLAEQQNENLRVLVEQLKLDIEHKNLENAELRGKMTRANVEIENLSKQQDSTTEIIDKLRQELKTQQEYRHYFETELNKLQTKLRDSQERVVFEQSECLLLRASLDKVQSECVQLKEAMMKLNYKSEREREYMLRHLEDIEEDIRKVSPSPHSAATKAVLADKRPTVDLSIDLAKKETEIAKLNHEVADLRMNCQQRSSERDDAVRELIAIKKELSDKQIEEQQLRATIHDLDTKLIALNGQNQSNNDLNLLVAKERQASEARINALSTENKQLHAELKQHKEQQEKFERTLKQFKSDLQSKENMLEVSNIEINRLSNLLAQRPKPNNDSGNNSGSETENKLENNKLELNRIKSEKAELEQVVKALNHEIRTTCERFESEKLAQRQKYETHITNLDGQLKATQANAQQQLEQLHKSNNELQRELESIKATVNASQPSTPTHVQNVQSSGNQDGLEKEEKIRMLESNIRLLMRKYKEAIVARRELEEKLNIQPTTDGLSNTDEHSAITSEIKQQVSQVKAFADQESQVNFTDPQCNHLIEECHRLAALIGQKDAINRDLEAIIIKLEAEKGQILNNAQENQHRQKLEVLENLIKTKDDEIESLTQKLNDLQLKFDDNQFKLEKQLKLFDDDLRKEKAIVKDLRHTIFLEKRDAMNAKKELQSLKKIAQEANFLADKRKQDVTNVEQQLIDKINEEAQLRLQLQQLTIELTQANEKQARLREQNTSPEQSQSQQLNTELSTVQLSLRQKEQEVDALNYKLIDVQRQHQHEINQLQFNQQHLQMEIEQLRANVQTLSTENHQLHATQNELRVALQSSFDANNKLRQELDQFGHKSTEPYNYGQSNLLTSLDSLTQEMDSLQRQIADTNNHNNFATTVAPANTTGHGLDV